MADPSRVSLKPEMKGLDLLTAASGMAMPIPGMEELMADASSSAESRSTLQGDVILTQDSVFNVGMGTKPIVDNVIENVASPRVWYAAGAIVFVLVLVALKGGN